jgi:hypothetical protein
VISSKAIVIFSPSLSEAGKGTGADRGTLEFADSYLAKTFLFQSLITSGFTPQRVPINRSKTAGIGLL